MAFNSGGEGCPYMDLPSVMRSTDELASRCCRFSTDCCSHASADTVLLVVAAMLS